MQLLDEKAESSNDVYDESLDFSVICFSSLSSTSVPVQETLVTYQKPFPCLARIHIP
ncbi:hypothetical protein D922_01068 [Enterococcus faecalis 06-MB-DW-09]|nr:hypothetical protein D922_01068 [Enterococcus faecalis 06-MB-DW-09]